MNYIIDPMWFYWTSVANSLLVACKVIGGLFGILSIIFGVMLISNMDGLNDDDYKATKKVLKVSIPISVLFILLSVFLPSKEVLIEMQIAKFATYENAEWTIDAIKGLVDYIVEAMKSV